MSEIYVLRWRKDDLPFWQDVDNDNRIGLYKVAEILTEHAALKRAASAYRDYAKKHAPWHKVGAELDALLAAEESE